MLKEAKLGEQVLTHEGKVKIAISPSQVSGSCAGCKWDGKKDCPSFACCKDLRPDKKDMIFVEVKE